MSSLRWGFLGTGWIAEEMARALQSVGGTITAVASRKGAKAQAFAQQFGIPAYCDSYRALCQREDVDVVYIALPHSMHRELSLCALDCGKHVLCEKPFTLNSAEAAEIFALAGKRHLFVMEAGWTRFIPLLGEMIDFVKAGKLGKVRMLKADDAFCMSEASPDSRILDPKMGGGALLDVGYYPLTLAAMLFGKPQEILSTAALSGGIDLCNAAILRYPGGEMTLLCSSIGGQLPNDAVIMGERGYLRLCDFVGCTHAELCLDGKTEHIDRPHACNGYEYQMRHVEECILAGLCESPVIPYAATMEMMREMDVMRSQWNLVYPGEQGN
ncbi:MAG: Gfo/Idh/MocA family oxidoreductase [Angelakisella sp.]